jgi:O-methyltransferase
MDNLFITRHFDWVGHPSRRTQRANALLRRLGYSARLVGRASTGEMSSVEQRINMYHLLSQLLVFDVPGDIVEFGSYEGQSAVLLRMILDQYDPTRFLHVYDAFVEPPLKTLLTNFGRFGLERPVVHDGLLSETLDDLPQRIAFAYVDLGPVPVSRGPGASGAGLNKAVGLVLDAVYPCIALHGIILLQDYWLPEQTGVITRFPGVRKAADAFFADKSEKPVSLHGGPYAHAFVRKQ